MARTLDSIALDISSSKGLKLSGGQFDRLVAMLRGADDAEEEGRRLAAMPNRELLELIGERRV